MHRQGAGPVPSCSRSPSCLRDPRPHQGAPPPPALTVPTPPSRLPRVFQSVLNTASLHPASRVALLEGLRSPPPSGSFPAPSVVCWFDRISTPLVCDKHEIVFTCEVVLIKSEVSWDRMSSSPLLITQWLPASPPPRGAHPYKPSEAAAGKGASDHKFQEFGRTDRASSLGLEVPGGCK